MTFSRIIFGSRYICTYICTCQLTEMVRDTLIKTTEKHAKICIHPAIDGVLKLTPNYLSKTRVIAFPEQQMIEFTNSLVFQ